MTDSDQSDELLAFTVASVWKEERVSCPHPDILRAYEAGALEPGATEFLDFHIHESKCPYCNAVLAEIVAERDEQAKANMADLQDRLMRSTVVALKGR